MPVFIDDLEPENCLHALIVRSPEHLGKLKGISAPAFPKGYLLATARDIPGERVLRAYGQRQPVLAHQEVRYLGEPVALVIGPDRDVLAELAGAVRVEVQPQEPTLVLKPPARELEGDIRLSVGEVGPAFEDAYQIVESEYRAFSQYPLYLENHGAVAQWEGRALLVHAACQDAFAARRELAAMLAVPQRRVRVLVPRIGAALEGKLLSAVLVAGQAALASHLSGRPVKIILNRVEEFCYTVRGPSFWIRHRTALDRDGQPTAVRVQMLMDAGAYEPEQAEILARAALAAWGSYRCPAVEVVARAVAINRVPAGPFRAAGRAQAFYAAELHTARVEEVAQRDPHSWKRQNLLDRGAVHVSGARLRGGVAARDVLDEAVKLSDFDRKYAAYAAAKKRRRDPLEAPQPLRGIGLSICYQEAGAPAGERELARSRAMKIILDKDRRVRIYTSLVDSGDGAHRLLAALAARLLKIDPARVSFEPTDTQAVPDNGTVTDGLWAGARLLEQCCQALQKRRLRDTPPITVQRRMHGVDSPWKPAAWREAGERARAWAATVVELEVDPVSLEPGCRGVWIALEAGRLWEAEQARAVVEAGVVQALGYVSAGIQREFPGLESPSGKPCARLELPFYALPSLLDVPPIYVQFLKSGEEAPIKGFEDLPLLGVAPAYASAVAQATSLYIDQIPVTPEVIQQCLLP